VYLGLVLPFFGINLPFKATLVVVTFVFGMIPVVGNVISNTAIVLMSLGQSIHLAVISLVFLIGVHKLEYFLNAKIVGSAIKSKAWELLLAMLLFESAFGVAGVIAAPIYYAFLKSELMQYKVV
jgi:predicted PurR-regulated permease PerM